MKRNHALRGVFGPMTFLSFSWRALLPAFLFCTLFAGQSAAQHKAPPPQTKQIVVRKQTAAGMDAVKMLFGTLKGQVTVPRFSRPIVLDNPLSIIVDDKSPQSVNASGSYLIKDLAPGTHKVKLIGRCWVARTKTATIRSQKTTILNIALGTLNGSCGG